MVGVKYRAPYGANNIWTKTKVSRLERYAGLLADFRRVHLKFKFSALCKMKDFLYSTLQTQVSEISASAKSLHKFSVFRKVMALTVVMSVSHCNHRKTTENLQKSYRKICRKATKYLEKSYRKFAEKLQKICKKATENLQCLEK